MAGMPPAAAASVLVHVVPVSHVNPNMALALPPQKCAATRTGGDAANLVGTYSYIETY
jgi:hypothetical protein